MLDKPVVNLNRSDKVILRFSSGDWAMIDLEDGVIKAPCCHDAVLVPNDDHSCYELHPRAPVRESKGSQDESHTAYSMPRQVARAR